MDTSCYYWILYLLSGKQTIVLFVDYYMSYIPYKKTLIPYVANTLKTFSFSH